MLRLFFQIYDWKNMGLKCFHLTGISSGDFIATYNCIWHMQSVYAFKKNHLNNLN